MTKALTRAQLERLYLPSAADFSVVDVPPMDFFMIDGEGSLHVGLGEEALEWLFAAVHPIKRLARQRMGKDFVEPPLEGLWWGEDAEDFAPANRDRLRWTMMIPAPHWADDGMLRDAVEEASERLGEAPTTLRLDRYDEGRSVQIMHVGHHDVSCATLERLHREFLPANDLVPDGPHHEIYLNDPRRTAPEKRKTVLRQPVRPGARLPAGDRSSRGRARPPPNHGSHGR